MLALRPGSHCWGLSCNTTKLHDKPEHIQFNGCRFHQCSSCNDIRKKKVPATLVWLVSWTAIANHKSRMTWGGGRSSVNWGSKLSSVTYTTEHSYDKEVKKRGVGCIPNKGSSLRWLHCSFIKVQQVSFVTLGQEMYDWPDHQVKIKRKKKSKNQSPDLRSGKLLYITFLFLGLGTL